MRNPKKPDVTTNQEITDFNFEQALGELEQLVEQMEKGDLGLEQSLIQFERGVRLTRLCQEALAKAEQKVLMLAENRADSELLPLAIPTDK